MERVSLVHGENPILIVVPHGAEHENLAKAGEMLAHDLGGFAVINRGWRRSQRVNHAEDLANCNDVRHLHEDVVREEFLNPVLRMVARIKRNYSESVLMFVLLPCGEDAKRSADGEMLDLVVGYGAGNPPSYSCGARTKNALIHFLQEEGFGVYEGDAGSRYSGKAKNSLNQLFVRSQETDVESVQLAVVGDMISDDPMIAMTVEGLVSAVDSFRSLEDDQDTPVPEVGRI